VHARASAEHFQKCTEFPPLRNRALGPLAVTALPIPLARRAAATVCAAVQSAVAFFRRWRPATSHYASSAAERSYGRLLRWVCSVSHQVSHQGSEKGEPLNVGGWRSESQMRTYELY